MTTLPLGSIVLLNHAHQKIMITARFPLTRIDGTTGYFEYGAVPYPQGQTSQRMLFFNHEDIAQIVFAGYTDHEEERILRVFEQNKSSITAPRLSVNPLPAPPAPPAPHPDTSHTTEDDESCSRRGMNHD